MNILGIQPRMSLEQFFLRVSQNNFGNKIPTTIPKPENVYVPDRNFTINIKNSKSLHVNVNQLNFFYDCTLDNYVLSQNMQNI